MTKKTELKAKTRQKQEKSKDLRATGIIPAVLYGPETKNINLNLERNSFVKVYEIAGESNLVDLTVDDGEARKVIIKEVQRDPVRGQFIHADLYEVDMKKPLTVDVPLIFTGESKAEKELGGVLIKNMESLEIECLPGDLVENIEVDISALENLGDNLHVNDIDIPKNLTLLNSEDDMVVSVLEPKEEEEEVAEEAPAEADETAEGEEEKKEGEAPADVDKAKEEKKEEDKK